MKVIAYNRMQCTLTDSQDVCLYSERFYVPDLKVVFAKRRFRRAPPYPPYFEKEYVVWESDADALKEANAVARGEENADGSRLYLVTTLDIDEALIRAIIQDARLKKDVREQIKANIEILVEKADSQRREAYFTQTARPSAAPVSPTSSPDSCPSSPV